MTLSELMSGVTPSASYAGIATSDDYVLAVNLAPTPAVSPDGYYVAQGGVSEVTGSLEAETQETQYIRTGKSSNKTGTTRTLKVSGDRLCGDAFQDAILDFAIKFGKGATVIKDYVYFNMLTGVGEKGKVSIVVEDDTSGGAGENASWSATLTSTEEPAAYTYEAPEAV